MKLPLGLVLQIVDKALAVAQFVDGLLTRRRKKKRAAELLRPRVDRGAPTVVLRRRPPTPTNPPR
ncbi:MAG TPA: hypothetical protein VFM95_02675 [Microcella sp.]|nr:hypothetical protein [Microcella sp.]